MHYIPVWGKFRYAEKMAGPLTLCVSLLAAFGADRLAERPSRLWSAFAACGGVLSLLAALFLANWHGSGTIFTAGAAHEAAPIACRNLAVGFTHAGLALLALAGLITGALRRAELRIYFPAAAAFLVFLQ